MLNEFIYGSIAVALFSLMSLAVFVGVTNA